MVENLEIKRKIFGGLEDQLKPGAILATNTSSIELERIAEGLKDPARLIGLHFFNPVAQLPLVEVIRSTFNTDAEIGKGAAFALAIGKSPVVVKSAPGFLVNRVLMPYMLGAVQRVEAGESKELLDAAAVAFGMPMGPIELMDTVGLDVGKSVAHRTGPCRPRRLANSPRSWPPRNSAARPARASTNGSTARRKRARRPSMPILPGSAANWSSPWSTPPKSSSAKASSPMPTSPISA